MTKHRLPAMVVVAVGALGIAAAVQAGIPDSSGTIHGCYAKSAPPGGQAGALRVIDTASGQSCQLSEAAVNWSQTGPQGPQGPQGVQGPKGATGPQGPKGDPGANAYFAGTGLTLTGGNTFNLSGSYRLPQGCGEGQSPAIASFTWTCSTPASSDESCSGGKFVNGVNSTGDLTCATPAGSAGPGVWSTTTPVGTFIDTPQDANTTIDTLSLPAGNFLVNVGLDAQDDIPGSGRVSMFCFVDRGTSQEPGVNSDTEDTPMSILAVVTLTAPGDVNTVCHDYDGSDHVEAVMMTALQVGTLH